MTMWLYAVFVIISLVIMIQIYLKLATKWCRSQLCLLGKTVIVTGANTGT